MSQLQSKSSFFGGLTHEETQTLSDYVSLRLVPCDEVAVKCGSTLSWFALLCRGSMLCKNAEGLQVRTDILSISSQVAFPTRS